jgi:hypothetical protein
MPFSQSDRDIHLQILNSLSMAFSYLSEELNIIIEQPHRDNDLEWKENFDINIHRIEVLKNAISDITDNKSKEFGIHGLEGSELKFKYKLIANTFSRFKEHYGIYLQNRGKGALVTIRFWLTKFLSYMNAYLASLSNIFPIAGVIKEFKEFIESSVGVNQRL